MLPVRGSRGEANAAEHWVGLWILNGIPKKKKKTSKNMAYTSWLLPGFLRILAVLKDRTLIPVMMNTAYRLSDIARICFLWYIQSVAIVRA